MRYSILLSAVLLFLSLSFLHGQVSVVNPLCENLVNPLGLDQAQPNFSWQLESKKRNIMQTAYEIRVGMDQDALENGKDVLWTSGKITSASSVYNKYSGQELNSGEKYFWQVRVWDNNGKESKWSTVSFWQMGLLNTSDWKAEWIGPGYKEDTILRPSPYFRKEFQTSKPIKSVTAYISALGMYEAYINGKRIGDLYLTPGWTVYQKRIQYQAYNVTDLIQSGQNAVGIILGSGWYRGFIGFSGNKNFYGKDIATIFQMQVNYTDGTSVLILSDGSWKSSTGAIQSSEIYNGEIVDSRKSQEGWNEPGFDDTSWKESIVVNHSKEKLIATYNESIKKHEIFKPKELLISPTGEQIIDFGQNLVGWVEIKLNGSPGDSLIIEHAEVLDKKGNFYTENLRSADQKNIFILNGDGEEHFEPHFTFQGFRYIKISGIAGNINPENFTAVALYSDMKMTGKFNSSDSLINQLQHNIEWGQKGNFLDVPTDCPQRDERLGWTGDAQAFSRTATFNMHVNNFFVKWMKDLAEDQQISNGSVPFVVPNVLGTMAGAATGWADAATIIPWNIYLAYGNKQILKDQYESMKSWVDYMTSNSKNDLWNQGFHFGDWLFYAPEDDNDGRAAVTNKYLLAQSFYANSTQILIKTAKLLGKDDDVEKYTSLLTKIKKAFLDEYVTPNGGLVSGTQTAYVIALQFDMLPENLRDQAAKRLADNVIQYRTHLTTGFLGTPYLCHVLTRFGYTDLAYRLLFQETYPSWLYPVKMGATTIWERWDGIKPDGSFQTPGMNSYNHYAYGAIGDWMYRIAAGLDTFEDEPGYKHIKIKPTIGGKFTSINASLETYYGEVGSKWEVDQEGNLSMKVIIPHNTYAKVYIPAKDLDSITENNKSLSKVKDIKVLGKEGNYVMVELGSGEYLFNSKSVTK